MSDDRARMALLERVDMVVSSLPSVRPPAGFLASRRHRENVQFADDWAMICDANASTRERSQAYDRFLRKKGEWGPGSRADYVLSVARHFALRHRTKCGDFIDPEGLCQDVLLVVFNRAHSLRTKEVARSYFVRAIRYAFLRSARRLAASHPSVPSVDSGCNGAPPPVLVEPGTLEPIAGPEQFHSCIVLFGNAVRFRKKTLHSVQLAEAIQTLRGKKQADQDYYEAYKLVRSAGKKQITKRFRGDLTLEDVDDVVSEAVTDLLALDPDEPMSHDRLMKEYDKALERHRKRVKRSKARRFTLDLDIQASIQEVKTLHARRIHLHRVADTIWNAGFVVLDEMNGRYRDVILRRFYGVQSVAETASIDVRKRARRQFFQLLGDRLVRESERRKKNDLVLADALAIIERERFDELFQWCLEQRAEV